MISIDVLKKFLIVSVILSAITCTFIQKTKVLWKTKKYLVLYSFLVNIIFSIIFCMSFTTINFPMSLWTGLFSFLGADTIYRSLEGKLSTYEDLRKERLFLIKKENIIEKWNKDKK